MFSGQVSQLPASFKRMINMLLYTRALDSAGEIVDAKSLVGVKERDNYTCLSCNSQMISRVNGKKQRPHFAHKATGECNGETYLHKLAKQTFVEAFRECQAANLPFTIQFSAPRVCNRFRRLIHRMCTVGEDRHEYDLTRYYTELRVEKRDGKFIPDISLHSEQRPDDVVYVEIAVSSFLSPEKADSGNRIIEIPVRDEDDIDRLRSKIISDQHATFLGFFPKINVVADAECRCASEDYNLFYILQSGKAYLDQGCLRSLESKINAMKPNLVWMNLFGQRAPEDEFGFYTCQKRMSIFLRNVQQAKSEGVVFKNCYMCKYHNQQRKYASEHALYCWSHKRKCNSNDAIECDRYRLR